MDNQKRTFARTAVHTVLGATLIASTTLSSAMAEPVESIYFVNPLPQFPAWRLIGDCMAQEADRLGVTLTETGPTDGTLNTNVMMQQVQQGMSNDVDAIVTFPASDGFVPLLEQAGAAGILVGTLYGSGFTASASNTNVGANFATVGQIMVETLVEREGPQNVGLMVQGPSGAAKEYQDAFIAAAEAADNVTVVATVFTEDNASKALDQANALLTAHPEINVIASHMGTATQGTVAAINSRGLVGDVVMLANGAAGGGQEGLEDGTVHRIMMQSLCSAGTQIVDGLVKIGNGEDVPAQLDVGIQMFGAEGLQQYLDDGWQ
ncbi:MAG: sugar ABC transporter substrate-binding protein [Yoonia sp.]